MMVGISLFLQIQHSVIFLFPESTVITLADWSAFLLAVNDALLDYCC
jgi:hypothetical protein